MGYLSHDELKAMGFKSLGKDVRLSSKASFYNCANISIADHVRIDDFCVLSAGEGGITIGNYVHIAVFSSLIGAGRITLADYCNISSRVSLYSSSDDYSGEWMTNPMVPSHLTNVDSRDVQLGKHVIIGSGTVVLPGTCIADGVAVGALSLVKSDCVPFSIYSGVPARLIRSRSRRLIELEAGISPS